MTLSLNLEITATNDGLVGTVQVSRDEMAKLRVESDRLARSAVDAASGLGFTDRAAVRTNRSIRRTRTSVLSLRSAFVALGGALVVRELLQGAEAFIRTADASNRLQARLRLVTEGTGQLVAIERALFDVAQDVRGEFEKTVDLYSKLARGSAELGFSQSELLTITEAVTQSVAISGSTAVSAAAGLQQFAQGIGSTVLAGDELRSVRENIIRLAQAIADGMDVSIADLKRLGEEGELTAEKVLDALLTQAPTLEAEFNRIPRTVEQAMTQVSNSLFRSVGQTARQTAVTEDLVETVDELRLVVESENFKSGLTFIAEAIAAIALAAAAGVEEIGRLAAALNSAQEDFGRFLQGLSVDIQGGPAGLIAGPIGRRVREALAASDTAVTIPVPPEDTAASPGGRRNRPLSQNQIDDFEDLRRDLDPIFAAQKELEEGLKTLQTGKNGGLVDTAGFNALKTALETNVREPFLQVLDAVDPVIAATREYQTVKRDLARAAEFLNLSAEEEIRLQDTLFERYRAATDPVQELNRQLFEQLDLARLLPREREIEAEVLGRLNELREQGIVMTEAETAALRGQVAAVRDLTEESDLAGAILDRIKGPRLDFEKGIAKLRGLRDEGRITAEEFAREFRDMEIAVLDNSTSAIDGFRRAILKMQREIEDVASQIENATREAVEGIEDGIVNLLTGQSTDLKAAALEVAEAGVRFGVRQLITGPLLGALGDLFPGADPTGQDQAIQANRVTIEAASVTVTGGGPGSGAGAGLPGIPGGIDFGIDSLFNPAEAGGQLDFDTGSIFGQGSDAFGQSLAGGGEAVEIFGKTTLAATEAQTLATNGLVSAFGDASIAAQFLASSIGGGGGKGAIVGQVVSGVLGAALGGISFGGGAGPLNTTGNPLTGFGTESFVPTFAAADGLRLTVDSSTGIPVNAGRDSRGIFLAVSPGEELIVLTPEQQAQFEGLSRGTALRPFNGRGAGGDTSTDDSRQVVREGDTTINLVYGGDDTPGFLRAAPREASRALAIANRQMRRN